MRFRQINIREISLGVVVACLLFASCASEETKRRKDPRHSEYLRPLTVHFTRQDSDEVWSMVKDYVECIKSRDYTSASHMLYVLKNDSVREMSDEDRASFEKVNAMRNVYAAKITGFGLRDTLNNRVRVMLQIIKSGDIDKGQGVTTLTLNPIKKDGKWYLTLLDVNAEGVVDVYRDQLERQLANGR